MSCGATQPTSNEVLWLSVPASRQVWHFLRITSNNALSTLHNSTYHIYHKYKLNPKIENPILGVLKEISITNPLRVEIQHQK